MPAPPLHPAEHLRRVLEQRDAVKALLERQPWREDMRAMLPWVEGKVEEWTRRAAALPGESR